MPLGVGLEPPANAEYALAREELLKQMEETRRLLGGDYWTLSKWFQVSFLFFFSPSFHVARI